MLTINTRNDKLTAARADFSSRGMLDGSCLSEVLEKFQDTPDDDDNDDNGNVEDDPNDSSDDGQDLDADEDEDGTGPVDGPPTLSDVTLAQKRGKSLSLFHTFGHC